MRLIANIQKRLGSFHLNVEIDSSDMFIGILGASGCGKSMTLKCIAGIEKPDTGYIELDGKVLFDSDRGINVKPQNRGVGYLFQNYALFPTMSVKKNIMCALRNNKGENSEKYDKAIKLFHLEGLEKHKPYQLSGGQAQRVALARMLISGPSLLLLDEPFSALDSFLRKNIQNELSTLLNTLKKQTVIVTHSQREVKRMCSEVYLMMDGRVLQNGNTDYVFNNPINDNARILLEE